MNTINRIKLFLSIVWRPCETPIPSERQTLKQRHRATMGAPLAWKVAGIVWSKL